MHIVRDHLVDKQAWPVLRYVLALLEQLGVDEPQQCVETAPVSHLHVDRPGDLASPVRLRVRGLTGIEGGSRALSAFVPILRGCVTLYMVRARGAAGSADPIVVSAGDLYSPPDLESLSARWVTIAGLLLEVEGLLRMADGRSNWEATLDPQLLRFARVGCAVRDYLELLDDIEAG